MTCPPFMTCAPFMHYSRIIFLLKTVLVQRAHTAEGGSWGGG